LPSRKTAAIAERFRSSRTLRRAATLRRSRCAGGLLGVEHFTAAWIDSDANATKVFDGEMSREIANVASAKPQLYAKLSFFYKFVYGELTPQCRFD